MEAANGSLHGQLATRAISPPEEDREAVNNGYGAPIVPTTESQPTTSYDAILRFQKQASKWETASRPATRRPRRRLSDSEIEPVGQGTYSWTSSLINKPRWQASPHVPSLAAGSVHAATITQSHPEEHVPTRTDFIDRLVSGQTGNTMLGYRRTECLEHVFWTTELDGSGGIFVDEGYLRPHNADCVKVLECWKYEGVEKVLRGKNLRYLDLGDISQNQCKQEPSKRHSEFEERLECWLHRRKEYKVPKPEGAGNLQGGLRIAMCDRPNITPGMTMTRAAFEKIEREFNLHSATLPALFDGGGNFLMHKTTDANGKTMKIQVVVKAVQKVEISNFLLSLTHDVASGWTDAYICGDGIVFDRGIDSVYGKQEEQLLAAIISCGPDLWTNPLLLVVAVLQMYSRRTRRNTRTMGVRLREVENHLGVTFAGASGIEGERPAWPMDVDVKWATIELHSVLPQILFMASVTSWQSRFVHWLLDIETDLASDPVFLTERRGFAEVRSTISFIASSIDSMEQHFAVQKGRAQSQIDLLFSVVGQRDALISQKANDLNLEVARATKEDSISMSTFTFITAMFLPSSFVATLFSMSMFNWADGNTGNGARHTLSTKFWIFWVVAVPLTALTIGGWYVWYRYADRKWQERLDRVNKRAGKPVRADDLDGKEVKNQVRKSRLLEERKERVGQQPSKSFSFDWTAGIPRRRRNLIMV